MIEETSLLTLSRVQESNIDTCPAGSLDGRTIMRYAPFHSRERSNGGVEQYLRCLNRGLLERHELTILQVYRVRDIRGIQVEVEEIEKGRVFWVPVPHQRTGSRFKDLPARARFIWDQTMGFSHAERIECETSVATPRAALAHLLRHLRHRSVTLSDPLSRLLSAHKVDLLAIHGLTYDAEVLIDQANRSDVPFVLVNHFDNAHFCEPQVQKWIPDAAGVGAVSARDLPSDLGGTCVNLSDAVDTDFFALERAKETRQAVPPMVLLPALIKPGKGHHDLIRAAKILADRNLDFQVCCAGAVESPTLFEDLHSQVAAAGLQSRIHFVGELVQDQIRNYYRRSSVVVLPSYCEGLGRSLLEAQAMHRPVVAYDSGGISETFIANETGFLVKTGDTEGLAEKIAFLLSNQSARESMGKRGREFVNERFSVARLIDRHEKFYLRALAHHPRPSFRNGKSINGDCH